MVSTQALNTLIRNGMLIQVYDNKEAALYYSENRSYVFGYNYNIVLNAGEFLAVSKEIKFDAWTSEVQNSTKGTFAKAKKAFEKYSPETMKRLRNAM